MASHADLLHIFLRDWKVHIRPVLLISVISVVCVWFVRQLASPLNKYPGPPLAGEYGDLLRPLPFPMC